MRPELPLSMLQRADQRKAQLQRQRLWAAVLLLLVLVAMAVFVTYVSVP